MSVISNAHPLSSHWKYYESRDDSKLAWEDRKIVIFTAHTMEDAMLYLQLSPRLVDVLSRINNSDVKREILDKGTLVTYTYPVDEYSLARGDAKPDTAAKNPDGTRVHLNGYRIEIAYDDENSEVIQDTWERLIATVIGHVVDPSGIVTCIRVFPKKTKSLILCFEIFFKVYSDKECVDVCNRISEVIFPNRQPSEQFMKSDYYKEKHFALPNYAELGITDVQKPNSKVIVKPPHKAPTGKSQTNRFNK